MTANETDYGLEESRGAGWIAYAGIMLIVVGLLDVFQGILMIAGDEIHVTGPDQQVVVVADVTTWGWIILVIGVLELVAGGGVFTGNQAARSFGVVVASLAILAQFPVFFGSAPLWSLTIVVLNAFIVYGLVVYGGKNIIDIGPRG